MTSSPASSSPASVACCSPCAGAAIASPGTGTSDGGLVIDLGLLKEIEVDPNRRVARAQPGLRWGEFDRATQEFKLATPGGAISDTGIAGLTLRGRPGLAVSKVWRDLR